MASQTAVPLSYRYQTLREVVSDYPGVIITADQLIQHLNKEHRDWNMVLEELKSYALKNFSLYKHHARAAEVIGDIISIFTEAFNSSEIPVQKSAVNSLLFYIEKIITDGRDISEQDPVLMKDCFSRLCALSPEPFSFVVCNPRQLKRIGRLLVEKPCPIEEVEAFNALLYRTLLATYSYWLSLENPSSWFELSSEFHLTEEEIGELRSALQPISHANLRDILSRLQTHDRSEHPYETLRVFITFPSYVQIVRMYEELIPLLYKTSAFKKNPGLSVLYPCKLIETPGLSLIHEAALREIGRFVVSLMGSPEKTIKCKEILAGAFQGLKNGFSQYPETVLSCVQSIGNEVFKSEDSAFVEWFLQKVISLGFQYPRIEGSTQEWQIKANKAHLKNVRVWLSLIELKPKWAKSLASALMINLRLGGVHVSDTDIFQKDITKLLNSDIRPVYHLIKQTAKIFPVYFNEINAEGALRDISAEVDEMSGRQDALIHFLRKQIHVESSVRVIDFIEAVILFWRTKDKAALKKFLPEEILSQVQNSGPFFEEIHAVFCFILTTEKVRTVKDLFSLTDEDIKFLTDSVPNISEQEKKRARLMIILYQLLHRKYTFSSHNVREHLQHAQYYGLLPAETLIAAMDKGTAYQRIEAVMDYLELLRDIILSPECYEAVEDISRKRHIAAGIPSVTGRYSERKFNALALTFRLEHFANILFEELLEYLNLRFITRASLFLIKKLLSAFFKSLQLDGISSNRLQNNLDLLSVALEVRRFSFSQYIDIFRGFSDAVQDVLTSYYINIHKNFLKAIVLQMGASNILPKYLDPNRGHTEVEMINTISEQCLRELVGASFAFQQLDNFISGILKTLFEQSAGLSVQNLDLLMSYDPKKALSNIHDPNKSTLDRIHFGNKGHNLVLLASLGIAVPKGFIITTEVFRCLEAISRFAHTREHLNEMIEEQLHRLERHTGKVLGDPDDPLIVSVRSGGAISMPGMMTSLLNVGLNEAAVAGLIKQTGRPWFAWDCYRRFLQSWGMSFGVERDKFDSIIDSYKKKYNVGIKIRFFPEQMKEVALAYREMIKDLGILIIDDPMAQLHMAIARVFESWLSKKAQDYREILGISDNWGTAVIVQEMIYGNLGTHSGTGVLFTRNPKDARDRVMPWGDFTMGAQGEDIVSGLVRTLPISNEQREIEGRSNDPTLQDTFPEIYDSLSRISKFLVYDQRWSAQEIEFTFEGKGKEHLFILQTRDMAVSKKESLLAFVPSPRLSAEYLSSGIGAGGGVLSGRVVFDLEDIASYRQKEPAMPLILVRSDTVPDDIRHISSADGLLTARGGATSHAAIIANRLGKTCVVGCTKLTVWEQEKRCKINRQAIRVGDFLSIDGRNGSVYFGRHEIKEINAFPDEKTPVKILKQGGKQT